MTIPDEDADALAASTSGEGDAIVVDDPDGVAYLKKRVRMPSTVLSELYPELKTPTFDESFFGKVDISEDKETVQYGELKFAPRYPCYFKQPDIPPTIDETPNETTNEMANDTAA